MKTEAQVRKVIAHIREVLGPGGLSEDEAAVLFCLLDVLAWVIGDPNTFQGSVFDPWEAIDRAARQ